MVTQKPDDITQHDWDIAVKTISQMPSRPPFKMDVARAIATAVSAEREACRRIAAFKGNNANMLQNDNVDPDTNRLVRDVSFEIAAAITNRALTQA